VELIPGTTAGLLELKRMGFGLVVITNQSGVGRGYFSEGRLASIHRRLTDLLAAAEVSLDGIYYCPHKPDDNCRCRKPQSLLVEKAAAELGFDPRASFVIGDKPCDIDLGRRVGAKTILVRTGYGDRLAAERLMSPDFLANDVQDAARIVGVEMAQSESSALNRELAPLPRLQESY
jgi:histidinol-phosphate phosphatase family protein